MPEVAFVLPEASPMSEVAGTLSHELELQGVPCSLHAGAFPPPRLQLVYVLIDPGSYVRAHGEAALPPDGVLRRTVFLCPETELRARGVDADLLARAGALFVLDPRDAIELRRLGLTARLLRPGYSGSLDHFGAESERPVDVCFAGAATIRQTRHLRRAREVLAGYRCQLPGADADAEGAGDGDGDRDGAVGSGVSQHERLAALARSKVALVLRPDDADQRVPWRRVLEAIHAGAAVVAEHASGLAPLVAGEHLLVASPEALPFVAETLLSHPERREALRAAAYERLRSWLPFALPVSVLRAAAVELVGEPWPSDLDPAGAAGNGGVVAEVSRSGAE